LYYGENVDEAIAMAKDAIDIYIEELQSRECTSTIGHA
jgi:predicted RNase H-like HicB family nuclease